MISPAASVRLPPFSCGPIPCGLWQFTIDHGRYNPETTSSHDGTFQLAINSRKSSPPASSSSSSAGRSPPLPSRPHFPQHIHPRKRPVPHRRRRLRLGPLRPCRLPIPRSHRLPWADRSPSSAAGVVAAVSVPFPVAHPRAAPSLASVSPAAPVSSYSSEDSSPASSGPSSGSSESGAGACVRDCVGGRRLLAFDFARIPPNRHPRIWKDRSW